jgi:hypothetical protein
MWCRAGSELRLCARRHLLCRVLLPSAQQSCEGNKTLVPSQAQLRTCRAESYCPRQEQAWRVWGGGLRQFACLAGLAREHACSSRLQTHAGEHACTQSMRAPPACKHRQKSMRARRACVLRLAANTPLTEPWHGCRSRCDHPIAAAAAAPPPAAPSCSVAVAATAAAGSGAGPADSAEGLGGEDGGGEMMDMDD